MIQRLHRSEPRRLPREGPPLEVPDTLQPFMLASAVPLRVLLAVALAGVLALELALALALALALEMLAVAEMLVLALAARPSAMARLRARGCWGAFCKLRWLWNAA